MDITSSSLNRMSIYAALGVPEVWRFDGETFTINLHREGENYEQCERGLALPALTVTVMTRFLDMCRQMTDTEVVKAFRAWVRAEIKSETTKPRRPRKK